MAYADYRLCDICERKAFYDANLNYEFPDKNGNDTYGNPMEYVRGSRHKLDHLGDWAVLCINCAKTHKCVIVQTGVEE
jgi:hypothetical protein